MADVKVLSSPAEAAAACAGIIKEALLEADAQGRPCALCLSGGATPKAVYFLLAKEKGLPWGRAEFYWGDERYVPETHTESNYRSAKEVLLDKIRPGAVHPMTTEAKDVGGDARRYETLLRARWPHAKAPAFDVLLLGIGKDGHTASLFPGSEVLAEKERWVEPVHTLSDKGLGAAAHEGPRVRITLTLPALSGSKRTAFLVVGEEKAEAVRDAVSGSGSPASLVPNALWLLDSAAAGKL